MGLRIAVLFLCCAVAFAAPGWVLVGWNDLGMHCMDGDYTVFSILPPYNTIHAQLIDSSGRLHQGGSGITVTYEAVADASGSINKTSAWKTRFWEFTNALFGVTPGVDAGLTGNKMPGAANQPQAMRFDAAYAWFTAEGIPVTAWDDAGNKNPYPMMRLVARDSSGTVLATTDIVLPVSDEMDCRTCHASGSRDDARPSRGWANAAGIERDYKLNILARHDDRAGTQLYASATAGTPVLCASCHSSNALGTKGAAGVKSLTAAIHSAHAGVMDPVTGLTLDASQNRSACYRCHPGSETRCLRGAMGAAVAPDGSLAIQCQSCHGGMAAVGGDRTGWLDQPTCQACHTGTAVRNAGQIRMTSALDESGALRNPVDTRFATELNAPAAGFSLYRFSRGHGGLACEACHGSTHAEYASSHDNDNAQSIRLQGHVGRLSECSVCHSVVPTQSVGGPHGMHPVGQQWVSSHGDYAEHGSGQCQDCHGADYRGTVLSRTFGDRTLSAFGTKQLFRGATVGCYLCHQGPSKEDANRNRPPVAANATAGTAPGESVTLSLAASDPDGGTPSVRIVSQARNGTVALSGVAATYTAAPGFEGEDTFTWAAWDGQAESALATVRVNVRAASRPVLTAEGVVNAASYKGGGVAPGEMATIFGTAMGPGNLAPLEVNSAGLLARSLAQTRVFFDGAPAPLIHSKDTQVTVMVPYSVAGKASVQVVVERSGIRSDPVTVPVLAAAPGLFARNMQGTGQGAILNEDGVTANSPSSPAPRGSVVAIFATGEGLTDHEWIDGQLATAQTARPVLPVKVEIGGIEAELQYAGSAPLMVTGFTQINARIPTGAPVGDAVPVTVRVGDAASQPGITLAVR